MTEMMKTRNKLGFLGILLPVTSVIFNLIFGRNYNPAGVLTSISATYYSSAFVLFIGLMGAVGLFMWDYRGYDLTDRVTTKIAAISAWMLILFPCALFNATNRNILMVPMEISNIIHLITAFLFFGSLTFIILFQFPKSAEHVQAGTKKWVRNIIYRICGILMIAGLIIGFGGSRIFNFPYLVYIGEWIALWSFGFAWLTKGGTFFKDL